MHNATILQEVIAKGNALKAKHPDGNRPPWAVAELSLWRRVYVALQEGETAKRDFAIAKEQYSRLEEFTEILEECMYQIMRFRPDFFELNSPAPSVVGAYVWLKLLQIMPESTERAAALKYLQDATPNLSNEPYQATPRPPFAIISDPGTYHLYERQIPRK